MKQRMKERYEKGLAIRSASSLALGTVRYSAKRRQRIGGVGIQLRELAIRTPTPLSPLPSTPGPSLTGEGKERGLERPL